MKIPSILSLLVLFTAYFGYGLTAEETHEHVHKCGEVTPEAKARMVKYKEIFAKVESFEVYEGLPNQENEEELLNQELKREDITKISDGFQDYPFYTPALKATNVELIRAVLSGPKCIDIFDPKKCGFHPDYCLKWTHQDEAYLAMICFGCGEIAIRHGSTSVTFDIRTEELKKLLAVYDNKRPKKVKAQ